MLKDENGEGLGRGRCEVCFCCFLGLVTGRRRVFFWSSIEVGGGELGLV